jgi:UDP-2-acetamido-3-amino-2,3-dideoxy-glucuronate N-acetyltransferase
MIHHNAFVHLKAHVNAQEVWIGAGTKVWQFATVIQGTKIGEDCTIGAGATLSGPIIGDRCKISSGVVMGPGFKIGNDVFIGPNVVLANDCYPEVGREGYDDTELRSGKRFCVVIGNGVSIGANTVILPGVTIGDGALVAAGMRLDVDVPPGVIVRVDGTAKPYDREKCRSRRMRYANGVTV